MTPARKSSLTAGIFYLLTFVSIPTLSLYAQMHEPNYIVGPGPDTPVIIGAILEWIVALSGIGTAVALLPVVKKQNEGFALGLVGTRVLEASAILVGIGCLLTVVMLRQAGAGSGAQVTGQALVGMYDGMFLLGQSLMPPINAVLLGTLMYTSRLVPRALPVLGLIGAPLLIAADLAVLFGVYRSDLASDGYFRAPDRAVGFSLAVWLTVKGFNPKAVELLESRT